MDPPTTCPSLLSQQVSQRTAAEARDRQLAQAQAEIEALRSQLGAGGAGAPVQPPKRGRPRKPTSPPPAAANGQEAAQQGGAAVAVVTPPGLDPEVGGPGCSTLSAALGALPASLFKQKINSDLLHHTIPPPGCRAAERGRRGDGGGPGRRRCGCAARV